MGTNKITETKHQIKLHHNNISQSKVFYMKKIIKVTHEHWTSANWILKPRCLWMSRLGWGGNIDAETNAFVGCCCKIILNWQLAKVKRPPQLPLTHVTIYFHFAFDLLWSSNLRWRQGYTSNVATILSNNINVNM